ncbi:MAG: hypothetical protein AAF483_05740 [Planctomycetota bacterium]
MNARDLVDAIAKIRPEYTAADHLRIALLLSLQNEDLQKFSDHTQLERQLLEVTIQLSATSDQHAAVSTELDSLATTSPCEFTQKHLWTLVKALKVQSQILNLYLG